jgi:hypothetical protein
MSENFEFFNNLYTYFLKLVVCILLRVLGQVQGFRLKQHRFEYIILFSNRYMSGYWIK